MKKLERHYLICYDIANPRRLQRVHRVLKSKAIAVQYSVFLAPFAETDLDRLLMVLRAEIDEREDDIRVYPVIPARAVTLGSSLLPDGIHLVPLSRLGSEQSDGEDACLEADE